MNKINNKIKFLSGNKDIFNENITILKQFDPLILDFIDDFSKKLDESNFGLKLTDLKSLSFWCRKKNIEKIVKNNIDQVIRVGLGMIFHITPSNIPTNFAYSLFFGLLNGNTNIVKVPSKEFLQIDVICKTLNYLLKKKKYSKVYKMISIIKYEHNNLINEKLSKICNKRVIWGGDRTISELRSYKIPPKSIDITFPDRYSFCIINSEEICKLKNNELKRLVHNFYNDTYLVDQNACSSPNLVFWIGRYYKKARGIFWSELYNYLKKNYKMEDIVALDKYTKLLDNILLNNNFLDYQNFDNLIYTLQLTKINQNQHTLNGKWGLFYEYKGKNIYELSKFVNTKFQTLTYFGIKKSILVNFFSKNILLGIDRIVPIGQALNMDFFWDGYDINKVFSRIVDIK